MPSKITVAGTQEDIDHLTEISLGSIDLSKVVGTSNFTFTIDLDPSLENVTGITEAKVCGETVRVRANAIAWCAGGDGILGNSYSGHDKYNSDNVYSWNKKQEVHE